MIRDHEACWPQKPSDWQNSRGWCRLPEEVRTGVGGLRKFLNPVVDQDFEGRHDWTYEQPRFENSKIDPGQAHMPPRKFG